ncbi:chorismate-binding protein [Desulfuromonas sp. AOP6]|uniref:chorismate-binding protein n=1 Tax=Desulfuromonas sp. AOP6 TaxID=1566351 RepID=UPI001288727C|nr:chorismate-binding protein [Desulfuromonas sp. AOP6]BCA78733.1 aminodeoxychorismate synthase, component I [Desulfuromonas sp. AOP6]
MSEPNHSNWRPQHGEALLYDPDSGCWLYFARPRHLLEVREAGAIRQTLRQLEEEVEGSGLWAAGFLSYEAAAAFDEACTVLADDDFPLLWFGLYDEPQVVELPAPPAALPRPPWKAACDEAAFAGAVATIRERIAAGETYQVNFTFPLHSDFRQDPWLFFLDLVQGQKASGAAYLDTGRYAMASASPELFFQRRGRQLWSRPMKGTAPRGRTLEEDRARGEELRASEKDRAENLMILDMIRNDLGRLGGAVRVPTLFTLEKYPTVWQLTSTAETETDAPLDEVFAALFPCASITGAPKYRTMQIIAELEQRPRRLYTGAFGYVAPQRRARFSVAIRTALIDRQRQRGTYGVGAGITWGSEAGAEYRECLQKGRILTQSAPPPTLLESLRWTPEEGLFLREEHLRRLADSAAYFDLPWSRHEAIRQLDRLTATLPPHPHKIRLLLGADGHYNGEALPLSPSPPGPLRLGLAPFPVDSADPRLYHKTTQRRLYDEARQACPDCDDVILWNERGEVTETTIANLVVEREDGRLITPTLDCGLLPGTFRATLLAQGTIEEGIVPLEELPRCRRLFLINSVRGWRPALFSRDFDPRPELSHKET